MKFLSGCGRGLAIFLILLIILFLPLTVFLRSLGSFLFTQERMISFIDQSFFDEEIIANILIENIETARDDEDFQNDDMQVVFDALGNLDEKDFIEIATLTLPEDMVEDLLDEMFSSLYDWLESDNRTMDDIVLDLGPLKRNIRHNTREILAVILDALPPCTSSQEEQAASFRGDIEDLPICRPGNEYYNMILDQSEDIIPDQLDRLNNEYILIEGSEIDLDESFRTSFKTSKLIANWLWLLPAFLTLIVIPMGARSIDGVFKWAGVPLFFSGLGMLLIALVVWLILPAILTPALEQSLSDAPKTLLPMVEMFINNLAKTLGRPILITGLVLSIIGFLSLVIGFGLQFLKGKDIPEEPQAYHSQPIAPSAPSELQTIVDEPVTDLQTIVDEKPINDQKTYIDQPTIVEDDPPKGMYG